MKKNKKSIKKKKKIVKKVLKKKKAIKKVRKKKKGGRLTKLREPIKKSKSYDGTYSDKAKVGSLKPKRCLHCNSQFINESEDTFCSGECKWSWSSMVYNNQGTTSFSSSNSSLSFYDVNNASLL